MRPPLRRLPRVRDDLRRDDDREEAVVRHVEARVLHRGRLEGINVFRFHMDMNMHDEHGDRLSTSYGDGNAVANLFRRTTFRA